MPLCVIITLIYILSCLKYVISYKPYKHPAKLRKWQFLQYAHMQWSLRQGKYSHSHRVVMIRSWIYLMSNKALRKLHCCHWFISRQKAGGSRCYSHPATCLHFPSNSHGTSSAPHSVHFGLPAQQGYHSMKQTCQHKFTEWCFII